MYTFHNTVKISDLRKHTDYVLNEIQNLGEAVTIFSRSKPLAVVMPYELYQRIQERAPEVDWIKYQKALDSLVNPPIKIKGNFDAVKLVRSLRD